MMQQNTTIEGLGWNGDFLKKAYLAALYPCILSIMSNCLTIIIDGIIVGQKIGQNGLTAISLCLPVYLVMCIFGSLFSTGTFISASNETGKDNSEAARHYYDMALFLCTISSVVMTATGLFLSGNIASLLCSDNEITSLVYDYIQVSLIGSFPKIMIYIPFWYLHLEGKNKTISVMLIIMCVANTLLDLLFMIGMDMGMFGAALASVIATMLACILGFFSCIREIYSPVSGFIYPTRKR